MSEWKPRCCKCGAIDKLDRDMGCDVCGGAVFTTILVDSPVDEPTHLKKLLKEAMPYMQNQLKHHLDNSVIEKWIEEVEKIK